jgi:PIN domain nuclease of toxin-antitoxin system
MIAAVADTHAALWHLFGDSRLSRPAAEFIDNAATQRHKIALSAVSLAELVYLIEKNRLPRIAYDVVSDALSDPEHVFTEAVCSAAVTLAMWRVPRSEIPDMPDRIIAATALYLDVPVISRDGRIRAANVRTVW